MFKTKEQALEYLKKCSKIVVPSKFTYWCHSSQVVTDKNASNSPKMTHLWQQIPTNGFTVKKEMSMLAVRDRLQYVAHANSFDAAPISYTTVPGQQGFQIKVMMPKNNLSKEEFEQLGKDQKYVQKLSYEHRGLGDGRHPKLSGNTLVHMFGIMDYDEMSKKPVQTVIGVRDEDLICYANEVQKEIAQMAQNGKVSE